MRRVMVGLIKKTMLTKRTLARRDSWRVSSSTFDIDFGSNVQCPSFKDTNVNLQMSMTVGSSKCKCFLFSQYFCSEGREKYTWQKSLHLKFPHRICFKVFPFQHRPITWEGVPNQTLGWAGSLTNYYCYDFVPSHATWCLSFLWRPMNPNFVYFKSEE